MFNFVQAGSAGGGTSGGAGGSRDLAEGQLPAAEAAAGDGEASIADEEEDELLLRPIQAVCLSR